MGNILYPPQALPLFVAFSFAPSWVWWVVPLVIVSGVVLSHRPSLFAWVAISGCIAWPWTQAYISTGNPLLWVVAALAVGTVFGWPAVLVALKPSLLPFALFGVTQRGWWVAATVLAGSAVLLMPLTLDYAHVLLNARGSRVGLLYSAFDIPAMLIPLLAWVGRRKTRGSETPEILDDRGSMSRRLARWRSRGRIAPA
jgi:hypothetical protein